MRSATWSINSGIKKQFADNSLLFGEFVQNGFHSLRTGFTRPFDTRRLYSQLMFNSFDIKRQMITTAMLNLNRDHDDFIRTVSSNGIATLSSYSFYPNNTNSLILLLRTQKTFNNFPFSFKPNVVFNWRSMIYDFDEQIRKSDIKSVNFAFEIKSSFESPLNMDYNISMLRSSNRVKMPTKSAHSTTSIINNAHLYFVMKKLFNLTASYYNISNNRISLHGNFLDFKISKKIMKNRMTIEANATNILNNREVGTQTISPISVMENMARLRSREFFFKVRYEFR